jgi:hypothetical protein
VSLKSALSPNKNAVTCTLAVIARQTVTHSRRDVIFAVAARAVQHKIRPVVYGRVVGQIGGAGCSNSDAIPSDGVTDRRALARNPFF